MRWINERAPEEAASPAGKANDTPAASTSLSITDRAFIGHLSHELRTPMNGVVGITELLAQTSGLSDQQRTLIGEIQQSSDALWGVVSDFLDFARLESDTLELQREEFDPHRTVHGAVDQMAANAQHRSLEIAGYVDPAVPRSLVGDASRLRQALASVIAIAIRLSHTGEIILRVGLGRETANAVALRVQVEAAGARLSEQNFRYLFEPFSLSDDSVTRRDAGTGLGLAVAQRLVRLMGGDVGVESGPGEGCTLWLETGLMPRWEIDAPPSGLHSQFAGKRVLLAVDNPRVGALLLQQLQDAGLQGEQVSTGEGALDTLRGTQGGDAFHLVILDGDLKDPNGLAVARILESEGLTEGIKLLLLSPLAREAEPEERQGTSIACELTKPVQAERLCAALDALLCDQLSQGREPGIGTDKSSARSPTTPARILLAEDNPMNRNLAKTILERAGYRVVEAENGQEAVVACKAGPFDLILMDCQMPLVDGFRAARAIRNWEQGMGAGGHVPIIAVTANALEEDQRKCMDAGMDDFLSKPFHQNDLVSLLQKWLPSSVISGG